MAVEAVASVVTQKLTDTLTQGSVMNQKVIVVELKKIKKALEDMGGYFLDAETEPKRSEEEVKKWAGKYLQHVYHVEDAIETFAGRFPCTPSRHSKTAKLTFGLAFLNKFTACHTLKREIKRIRGQIDVLNRNSLPPGLKDASVKSRMPQQPTDIAHFDEGSTVVVDPPVLVREEEEEEDEEGEGQDATMLRHAASTILEDHVHHNHTRFSGQLSKDNLFPGLRAMSDASVIADRLTQPKLIFSYSFDEEELDNIVGLKKDVRCLAENLLDANIYSSQVVSIVGGRGSGKTTLARAVYGSRQVKKHFKSCSAWVTASKESSEATVDLLLPLLRQIGSSRDQGDYLIPSDPEKDPKKNLKDRISELLKDKRYLIVLEDVESREMWNDLRSAFPDQHPQNGSKLLLITCCKEVAMHAKSQMHELKKLSHRHSWRLFLKKACLEECPEHGGLEVEVTQHLKGKILRVSDRLPLNIVLLGSFLSTKDHGDWSGILSSQANWNTSDLISLSYVGLPAHLKLCLIYMVLFPKEFDIPVRRLQRLWLAEGFVKRSEESPETFQEDEVKRYLDDLIKRSLIQVSKLTSDGSPKRCRLLGVLHDYLSPKAQVISLFHVHNTYSSTGCPVAGPFGVRRLVEYTDIKNCSVKPRELASLRSYLCFNTQKKDTPAKEVGILLKSILSNGLKLLRVLDLEGVYKPSLPDNLGDFFNLRYLGLRWTFLDSLPDSLRYLHYLETLDIKHTYIGTLPPFIWKMKHLKHLNANGIHLDLPRHFHSLPQLMTLSGFSVDERSLIKDGLKSLVHLRELEITFQLSNSEELLDWISKITAIQALRLRSKDAAGRPSKLTLKPLSSLKQLSHLHLLGNLRKLPDKDDFPPALKVLTLSVSQLREDPMPILGKLPKLTVLRLLANSYLEDSMICPSGGFKELRVLKLWMLKNLEHWDVEEGSMQRLEELNIRCCSKLKMIPSRLLQHKKLKELTLTNMSSEFRSLVESKKSPHVSLTINHYNFSPLPWEEANGTSDEGNSMPGNGHTKN